MTLVADKSGRITQDACRLALCQVIKNAACSHACKNKLLCVSCGMASITVSAVYTPRYSVEFCEEHVLCKELSAANLATICKNIIKKVK